MTRVNYAIMMIVILIGFSLAIASGVTATEGGMTKDEWSKKRYSAETIERIHTNATRVYITIEESDGETWHYVKDAKTDGKWEPVG
jgi:hypothetical protein